MPGHDAIQLAERVVGILGFPERAGDRIEGHAEAVAMAVGEHLLDVRADLAAHRRTGGEERIVGRRGAVAVEADDHAGQVCVVGRGAAERVVDLRRR